MRIVITSPAGVARPISDTRWAPLASVLETLASRGEEAVLGWCGRGGMERPAVDDAVLEGDSLTLLEYDPDAAVRGAEAFA